MKAQTTLMWNKAKTLLVPVGDPEGRFFAYAEGYPIPDDSPLKVKSENKTVAAPKRREELNG
jgi:hypothetical protein